MSGHWTHRDIEIHRCSKPPYDITVKVHDRWQCFDCDREWIVTKIEHGMQHDPIVPPVLVWAEYESWKSVPFPPGTK